MNVEEVKIAVEAIDPEKLENKLKTAIEGEVHFDKGTTYSTDDC